MNSQTPKVDNDLFRKHLLDEEDRKRRHQPSFLRQVLYTLMVLILMTGLVFTRQ